MKLKLSLLTFFFAFLSLFSVKFFDDAAFEKSFNKGSTKKFTIVKKEVLQVVKTINSAPKKEENLISQQDFEELESLDFYNINDVEENFAEDLDETIVKNIVIEKKITEIDSFKLKRRKFEITKNDIIKKDDYNLSITEPVKLTKVISKKIESTNWSSITINVNEYQPSKSVIQLAKDEISINKEKLIVAPKNSDQISTTLSANEKVFEKAEVSLEPKKTTEVVYDLNEGVKKSKQDDLVFFDYSPPDENQKFKKMTEKVEEVKKVSSTITNVKITKALPINMKNEKKTKTKKQNNSNSDSYQLALLDRELIKSQESNKAESKLLEKTGFNPNYKKVAEGEVKAYLAEKRNTKVISDYILQAYSAGSKDDLRNFEVRFSDDQDDILQDDGTGEVVLSSVLNNSNSIRRATILSRGNIPTSFDMILENGETVASVPVFSIDKFSEILSTQNIQSTGAHLLIELDKETEDTDIDANYQAKLFLSSNHKVVNRDDSDFNYILYIGVKAGNSIISFKKTDNSIVSKIIHLEREEIYYEPNFYIEKRDDEFDLFEENLLSKTIHPLNLDAKELEGLTFDEKATKLTTNKFKYKKVTYPSGTRSYVRLSHLKEPVFIGRWNNEFVKVPSESYMRYVLDQFSLGSVNSQCVVQLNLSKSAKEILFNGKASDFGMRVQAKMLDKDGLFYTDLSADTEKVFILGEEQGIINIKVNYADDTSDYIQSYCSDSTYLLEQL